MPVKKRPAKVAKPALTAEERRDRAKRKDRTLSDAFIFMQHLERLLPQISMLFLPFVPTFFDPRRQSYVGDKDYGRVEWVRREKLPKGIHHTPAGNIDVTNSVFTMQVWLKDGVAQAPTYRFDLDMWFGGSSSQQDDIYINVGTSSGREREFTDLEKMAEWVAAELVSYVKSKKTMRRAIRQAMIGRDYQMAALAMLDLIAKLNGQQIELPPSGTKLPG